MVPSSLQAFTQRFNKEEWYEALVKAIKNPDVNVIGHLALEIDFKVKWE